MLKVIFLLLFVIRCLVVALETDPKEDGYFKASARDREQMADSTPREGQLTSQGQFPFLVLIFTEESSKPVASAVMVSSYYFLTIASAIAAYDYQHIFGVSTDNVTRKNYRNNPIYFREAYYLSGSDNAKKGKEDVAVLESQYFQRTGLSAKPAVIYNKIPPLNARQPSYGINFLAMWHESEEGYYQRAFMPFWFTEHFRAECQGKYDEDNPNFICLTQITNTPKFKPCEVNLGAAVISKASVVGLFYGDGLGNANCENDIGDAYVAIRIIDEHKEMVARGPSNDPDVGVERIVTKEKAKFCDLVYSFGATKLAMSNLLILLGLLVPVICSLNSILI